MNFLSREATVARPEFSRWLVPPAAIAVHMCIGEVYGFSVFNVPLTQAGANWTIPQVGWIYSIALVMLGLSAALFGKWVERSGPRKTMVVSCLCFCGGLVISAVGVKLKSLGLLYLGYGFIGGIGLGLGYISPVSTLMKWFPDRPGMATGMAIMGFGGGALIGAPLGVKLMDYFKTPTSAGVAEAFLVMALLYAISMLFGACLVRVPPEGWKPEGWHPAGIAEKGNSPPHNVPGSSGQAAALSGDPPQPARIEIQVGVDHAWKTPQFWCLWVVLCMNVSAGIGILGQASKMCSDMFGVSPAVGGGFAGLLSIFNMGGRFVWSSISDHTGRKTIYSVYFLLGAILYCAVPWTQSTQNRTLFVIVTAIIITMYGGGFATIPAYLRDLFGTYQIGAIHGRLITSWSIAAIVGPSLINYISTAKIAAGVPQTEAYNFTMYLMAGLLLIGWVANLLVRPVAPQYHLHRSSRVESSC